MKARKYDTSVWSWILMQASADEFNVVLSRKIMRTLWSRTTGTEQHLLDATIVAARLKCLCGRCANLAGADELRVG